MTDGTSNYVDIELDIKYTNQEHLTISEIVQALESAEKIILRTKPFIEKASKGYHISDIQVFIEEAHSGSFFEKFKTRIYYGSEEKKEKAQKAALDYMENTNMNNLLPVFVGSVIGAGIILAAQSVLGGASNHIEAYNSNVFNFGDNAQISEEDAQQILNTIRDKKTLAKEATAMVSAAKNDPKAELLIGSASAGSNQVVLSSDVIAQTPKIYEPPQPTEKTESYENIDVTVIKLVTNNSMGWSGTIDGIVMSETKIIFADDIDATKIFSKKIKCNAEVIFKITSSSNNYKAKEIYISKVIKKPN